MGRLRWAWRGVLVKHALHPGQAGNHRHASWFEGWGEGQMGGFARSWAGNFSIPIDLAVAVDGR
jgi:hypothetical protein